MKVTYFRERVSLDIYERSQQLFSFVVIFGCWNILISWWYCSVDETDSELLRRELGVGDVGDFEPFALFLEIRAREQVVDCEIIIIAE